MSLVRCQYEFCSFVLLHFVLMKKSHLLLRNWGRSLTNKLDALVRRSEIYHRYNGRSRLFRRLFLYCLDRVTKSVAEEPCELFAASRSPRRLRTNRSLIGTRSHHRDCAIPSFVAGVSCRLE